MDYYTQGREFLDSKLFDKAETAFENGQKNGDIRCIYGVLATRASQHLDYSHELDMLKQVFDQLCESAKGGDEYTAFIIGRCYETGTVVQQDSIKAIEYYMISAQNGCADANFTIGCMYMGLGTCGVKNAKHYYQLAAEQGHLRAIDALNYMRQSGLI